MEHAQGGLLAAPGLGKTSTTLAAISFLKKRGLIGKVLIVAPVRVCYRVWPAEIKKWLDFNHLTCEVLHGSSKDSALARNADIYVINPEGLAWLLGSTKTRTSAKGARGLQVTIDKKRWKALGFDVLVVDELSKFKKHDTGRFKGIKQVLHTFGRRWGLTGSPATNGLMGLFGQAFMLDMGASLGAYITHYRDKYFDADKYGHTYTLKPGAEDKIYEALEPLMLRQGLELIGMPELIEDNIMVDLPDEVWDVYLQMEKTFLADVKRRLVTAPTAAAKSTKLRQIACGGVYLDTPTLPSGLKQVGSQREWANLHTAKVEALRDLTDELQGNPVLVAYDFEHDLDRLRKAFKDGVFACDYSMKRFEHLEARWNAGEIPILFAHPASMGHGLNLQGAAQHVAWHSMTWDRDLYDQFIARVWRSGNKFPHVYVHHLIAGGTIDEIMLQALRAKGDCQNAFFAGILKLAALRSET